MISPDLVHLSPNTNPYPMNPGTRTVVIHCTRSGTPMNPSEFQGTLNYMSTPGTTSSHWVVSRGGTTARVVHDSQQAWHAGSDNDNSWGIEIEQGVEDDGFTQPQLDALVAVCQGYVADFGVAPVHVLSSGLPGFVGHEETAQGQSYGKSDPGHLFPWDGFIAALNPLTYREWLYGDEQAGREVRGNQLFDWHKGVEIDAYGDYAGLYPGEHWHNEGGIWQKYRP